MARDHPPRVTLQLLPKRKSRNYPKSSSQKDTFSFRSEGGEGVNLHDAYVDTIRDLEGRHDPMFEGYGAKVTYIVVLSTKEHLKQMNAQTANGPITRVKVVKQVARIVWDAIREECAHAVNGEQANPTIDPLKPWYLMKIDRVGKAAFMCTLGQCSTDGMSHTTAASDTLSSFGVGSSVYSSNGDTTSSYFVPADNSSPMFITSGPSSLGPHQTYLSTIAGIPNIGDFPPDQNHTGASLQNVPSGSLHILSQLNVPIVPDANSIIAPSPQVTSDTATSAPPGPQNIRRGVDVPLDTSEWTQLHHLVARARNTTGMVFSISFPTVSGPASAHRDIDGSDTSPLEHRGLPITCEVNAHSNQETLDVQTSRIEPQGSTSFTGVGRREREQELMHADATSTGSDDGSPSDTDECDDFDENTDDWPKPGFRSTPHKWEFKGCDEDITSVRQYEEEASAFDCLFPRLLTYLCERFPEERSGLSASRDLEIQCCNVLDIYYKPFEDWRGQRSIRRQLQYDGSYAVATNSSNERTYCSVYDFFRVILPSGRTAEVANVSWLKPSVCDSGPTSSNRQIFEEDIRHAFVDVKSIIRPQGTDELEYESCGDCDKWHRFGPHGEIA